MLLELYAVALKQQIESVVIMFLTVSFLSTAQGLHYCKYSPVPQENTCMRSRHYWTIRMCLLICPVNATKAFNYCEVSLQTQAITLL